MGIYIGLYAIYGDLFNYKGSIVSFLSDLGEIDVLQNRDSGLGYYLMRTFKQLESGFGGLFGVRIRVPKSFYKGFIRFIRT